MNKALDAVGHPGAAGLSGTAVAGLLVGVFAIGSEALLLSPMLNDIARSFATGQAEAGLAVTVYGLALAASAPIVGLMGDAFSRRVCILGGLALFTLAGLAAASAQSLAELLAARAVCGLAAGSFLPAAYAVVGDRVPYADRARIMGRILFGWSAALVLGVPLGGIVGEAFGWRSGLALVALLGAMAAGFLWRADLSASIPAAAGAVGARVRSAAAEALRSKAAPILLAINFFTMLAFYGLYTYLGSFLRDRFGFGSAGAGLFVVLYGIGVGTITLNAGLLDRIGKQRALLLALLGLSVLLPLVPQADGSASLLAGLMLCWGICQGAALTATTTLVTGQSARARGALTAMMSCTSYLAVSVGSAAMGPVYEAWGFALVGVCSGAAALVSALLLLRLRSAAEA